MHRRIVTVGVLMAGIVGSLASGAPAADAATTPHVRLTVARSVPVGATTSLSGSVSPAAAGRRVRLQRYSAGAWHTVGKKRLTRRSTYAFSRRFATVGTYRYRTRVARHRGFRRGTSPTRSVVVAKPGYDVSYPQCRGSLPAGATFAVVGADGGRPFRANPCLAEQVSWADAVGTPAYYANTADPGPARSSFWPTGQRSPRVCSASARNSTACSYDYGWNAAKDALSRAVSAAASVGAPSPARAHWWLDVETGNTWQADEPAGSTADEARDAAALAGMRGYLLSRGVPVVGVYSTAHQWRVITGGASLSQAPVWYAGSGGPTSALTHCRSASFTGGPVRLAQYARSGFDADHRC